MGKTKGSPVENHDHRWYACDKCSQIQCVRKQGPKEIEDKSRKCIMTTKCKGKLRVELTEAEALKRIAAFTDERRRADPLHGPSSLGHRRAG